MQSAEQEFANRLFDGRFIASGFVIGFFASAVQVNLWQPLISLGDLVFSNYKIADAPLSFAFLLPYVVLMVAAYPYAWYDLGEALHSLYENFRGNKTKRDFRRAQCNLKYRSFVLGVVIWIFFAAAIWQAFVHGIIPGSLL